MLDAATRGVRSYAGVLSLPHARRLALGGLVGRCREAGTSLALILALRSHGSSFAVSALAPASYLAGAAVARPLHGRWIDRTGPRRPLLVASVANALALAAFALWVHAAGAAVLIGLSVVVGASLPALSAALRALWSTVAPPARAEHAYALDTLIYELTLIASPALVGLIATAASPATALLTVAGLGMAGTAIVATSPAAAGRPSDSARPTGGRSIARAVRLLIGASLLIGAAEGSMTVLAPGVAAAHDDLGTSGLLLSALSAGSLIGALAYTTWTAGGGVGRRLLGTTTAMAVGFVLLAVFGRSLAGFAVCAVVIGVALSPTLTTIFIAIRNAAPPAALTEAFTWASFCAAAGAAGAQAAVGWLISGPGVDAALWLAALIALASVAVAAAVSGAGGLAVGE